MKTLLLLGSALALLLPGFASAQSNAPLTGNVRADFGPSSAKSVPSGQSQHPLSEAGKRSMPAGEIRFDFKAYSNNVKVLPPLVGDWQLGVSDFSGSGVIKDGMITGNVMDSDRLKQPRPGNRSQSSEIIDATYQKIGDVQRLILTIRITASSHPSEECAVGLTGTLTIQDSSETLKNGKLDDFVHLTGWSGVCATHVHGWNNEDPGPRTSPPTGGPPDGGQWAIVNISVNGAAPPPPRPQPHGLPDGEIHFDFETYANNVKVLPPLIADFQLGKGRLKGSGLIKDGKIKGSFTDVDDLLGPRPHQRSITAEIIDGSYLKVGEAHRLMLTVRITNTSHPDRDPIGETGLLEIQDSPVVIVNGKFDDYVMLSWSGDCSHVHGWINQDPGPRTDPPTGGPPEGGQWAIVNIKFAADPNAATGPRFPEPMHVLEIGPKPGTAGPISYVLSANPDGFKVGNGLVKKVLGGPFDTVDQVRAGSKNMTITSLGPVQARVYDSKGNWLSQFIVLLDPSSGGGMNSTPSQPPSSSGTGASTGKPAVAKGDFAVLEATGKISVLRDGDEFEEDPKSAAAKGIVWGDHVFTQAASSLKLKAPDGTIIALGANSDVSLNRGGGGKVSVRQKSGAVEMHAPSTASTQTAAADATSEGAAKWRSNYDRNKLAHRVEVTEGRVRVTPMNRNLKPRILSAGQSCTIYADRIEPPDAGTEVNDSALNGLAMDSRLVRSGVPITMPVLLKSVPSGATGGLGNLNFEVSYNPAVVKVSGTISRGNLYGSDMLFEANGAETGRIRIGFAGKRGVTQGGTVAQIPFQVIGQPGQETALTLKVLQCQTPASQPVTLGTTHGKITIPLPVQPSESLASANKGTGSGNTSGKTGPPVRSAKGSCNIAGGWGATQPGAVGVTPWYFAAVEGKPDTYTCGVSAGPWPPRGTAAVSGRHVTIDVTYGEGGYGGSRIEFDLDELCNVGTGEGTITKGGVLGQKVSVTFTRNTPAPGTLASQGGSKTPAGGSTATPGGSNVAQTSGPISPTGQVTPTENLGGPSDHLPPSFKNPDGTIKGDLKGDGRLGADDAEGALQMSVGLRTVDMRLDVDTDNKVMSADARLILQQAPGGLDSSRPRG